MQKIKVEFANQPDPGRIQRVLADCYRASLERKTGRKYTVAVKTDEEKETPLKRA